MIRQSGLLTRQLVSPAAVSRNLATLKPSSRPVNTASRHKQHALPCAYYRGGTSRALIFTRDHLPTDRSTWPTIFQRVLGSPDPHGRQLDGMGGGISSLSKICIVGPAADKSVADVDYEFAAVGVHDGEVDFSSNCGNMSAAVGPYAWDHGMIQGAGGEGDGDGMKEVKILNVNSKKVIRSTFEVQDGEARADGDFEMPGVTGGGAPIRLDFLDPAGSRTGTMLPTGNPVDMIDNIPTSCVDVGIPSIFVKASDVGVDGSILPAAFDNNTDLRAKLESIRTKAGVLMGIAESEDKVPASAPKVCLVSPPATHSIVSGTKLQDAEFDLMVRAVSVGQPHRAVPITVALCLAATARIPKTVVHDCIARPLIDEKGITIGHPSGKVVVGAGFDDQGDVKYASVYRTARRLMEGKVYWKP